MISITNIDRKVKAVMTVPSLRRFRTVIVLAALSAMVLFRTSNLISPAMELDTIDSDSSSSQGQSNTPWTTQHKHLLHNSHANGGIIFFVHIPKTGGAAMRHNTASWTNFFEAVGKKGFHALQIKMNQTLSDPHTAIWDNPNRLKRIHFYSMHTLMPSFMQLRPLLKAWREQAEQQGSHSLPLPFYVSLWPMCFRHTSTCVSAGDNNPNAPCGDKTRKRP